MRLNLTTSNWLALIYFARLDWMSAFRVMCCNLVSPVGYSWKLVAYQAHSCAIWPLRDRHSLRCGHESEIDLVHGLFTWTLRFCYIVTYTHLVVDTKAKLIVYMGIASYF